MHSQTQLWLEVRRDLGEITQPVLLMHSRVDHVVPVASSAHFLEQIASTDVTEIWLENSYHVATLDNDAPLIHDESVRFIERVSGTAPPTSPKGEILSVMAEKDVDEQFAAIMAHWDDVALGSTRTVTPDPQPDALAEGRPLSPRVTEGPAADTSGPVAGPPEDAATRLPTSAAP